MSLFDIGLTDHLEGPRDRPSAVIFDEVADLVRLADELGVRYAWFTEHHAHAHHGHLPTPLLFALHLAGQTRRIRLGTAIICLNLHHPLDVAEQVAVADVLTNGRMAVGFGSGSTPEEFGLFGLAETGEARAPRPVRRGPADHPRGLEPRGDRGGGGAESSPAISPIPPHRPLPVPAPDLAGRCWLAVNSAGSARIAGSLGFNMLFSHLRTPEQYRQYAAAYREAGGTGLIAANRPVFVGPDDADRLRPRRARPAASSGGASARKARSPPIPPSPRDPKTSAATPSTSSSAGPSPSPRQLLALHEEVPFDVANVEVRWAGLSHQLVCDSLRRELMLSICFP